MDDLYQQLLFITQGGLVKRYHTIPTVKEVTIAEHSYMVAWLCYQLWTEEHYGYPIRATLLMSALSHDLAEQVLGDIPAPTKWNNETPAILTDQEQDLLCENNCLFPINPDEADVLRMADSFAGMIECIKERGLGNLFVEKVYNRWEERILTTLPITTRGEKVYQAVQRLWRQATNG